MGQVGGLILPGSRTGERYRNRLTGETATVVDEGGRIVLPLQPVLGLLRLALLGLDEE